MIAVPGVMLTSVIRIDAPRWNAIQEVGRRRLLLVWFALAVGFWALLLLLKGYHPVTLDFGSFWAATLAFRAHGAAAAYDLPTVAAFAAQLVGGRGGFDAPAPYPPPFFLLFSPLTALPLAVGFALWTLLNLTLSAAIVWPLVCRGPGRSSVRAVAVLLYFPLVFGLYLGQPIGCLLFGFYRAYRAFEEGQEFRAGLWLGVLLLKPQYLLFLALVVVAKRRWAAVRGLAVVGTTVAMASLALLGMGGVQRYRTMLDDLATFHPAVAGATPSIMVSWRGLLTDLLPSLTDAQGTVLTVVLSLLTAGTLVLLWRGPWEVTGSGFPLRVLGTILVTLLDGYHTHLHGVPLLLIPGLSLVAAGIPSRPLDVAVRAAFFVPAFTLPLSLIVTQSLVGEAVVFAVLLIVLLVAVVAATVGGAMKLRTLAAAL